MDAASGTSEGAALMRPDPFDSDDPFVSRILSFFVGLGFIVAIAVIGGL